MTRQKGAIGEAVSHSQDSAEPKGFLIGNQCTVVPVNDQPWQCTELPVNMN